jgi:hypothetical protein
MRGPGGFLRGQSAGAERGTERVGCLRCQQQEMEEYVCWGVRVRWGWKVIGGRAKG